ncbi:MAG: ABC transporter ATP-binding protein [Bacteroidetes bacterium]|nr:MAG: ABC transporter ATP-binding protein [Bacteroidota bacterium]REJ99861.1 MAG: ABC transporter ATP-binding protein [Bacteroidota bacterium]REK34234.1 MAG: ABC transporter ATP-binding protein [Bacteroidota bacterium]REK50564.1 MAG: ABC transporter ATP-binding protein [Bacteroidota bacterium]
MTKGDLSGKAFDLSILNRLFRMTFPYKSVFWISVTLTLLLAFLSPLRPVLVQYAVDKHIMNQDKQGLLLMSIFILGLLLVQTVVQYFHTYLTSWLGQTVIRDLRVRLFQHITSLRLKYFDKTPIGNLVTRTVSDLETIADIFSEGLIIIIGDLLQVAVIVIFMFVIDWRLALISLSTIPLLLIATRIFQKGIRNAFREVRTQVAALNTFVQEHISGISLIQVFNKEESEMEKFKAINKKHMSAHIRSVWYYSIFFPVVELLTACSLGLLVWWGSRGVIQGDVSLGNIIAFIMYISMLFRPIRELADKFNTLQMGMVSSERVFRVLDTHEHVADNGNPDLKVNDGIIEFKNVWFSYDDHPADEDSWVLRDISFKLEKGKTLAIVGATGAGKSSVINLLGRMYEFQKGEILIDGIDIRNYSLDTIRREIGVVLQDVFLFSDTVSNNITLRDPSISHSMVINAAKMIGADRFINKLPGSYDFNVMERGAMLSTGQRQLIAFIRALVFNPRILVLDEATSSIDHESEELIRTATRKITKDRTSIVIAHRLSTIQNADNIIVLDHGSIVEEGRHEVLLMKKGFYFQLHEMQFRNM